MHLDVRPDNMALLRAAREVVEEPGFQEELDSVRERVDEIESLHRTRELTVCLVPFRLRRGWVNLVTDGVSAVQGRGGWRRGTADGGQKREAEGWMVGVVVRSLLISSTLRNLA